jgi:hypothetical protein
VKTLSIISSIITSSGNDNISSTIMSIKDQYQEFKSALNDLKMNSKPVINFLTILAEEKSSYAPQIVRAIEDRILEVRMERRRNDCRSMFDCLIRAKAMPFCLFSTFSIQ